MYALTRISVTFLLILALLIFPLIGFAQATPAVIISEVAWAGSSLSAADEWVELANLSDQEVDASGFILEGAGSSGSNLVLPEGSTIAPNSTFLIANYDQEHANSVLASEVGYQTSSVSLSNSALKLVLRTSDGTLLDQAGDGGPAFAGRSGGTGDANGIFVTMERIALADGTLAASWADAAEASGLDAGVADLATPGSIHSDLLTTLDPEPDPDPATPPEPPDEPEPAPEPSPEIDPTPLPDPNLSFPPGTLVINELYPAPLQGEDEWVEIKNPYNNVIPLNGWTIADTSGKKTPLPDQLLGMNQLILLVSPTGKLNNGADVITLLSPTGEVIDRIAYGEEEGLKMKKGESISRFEDGLAVTLAPTPFAPNILLSAEPKKIEPEEEIGQTNNAEKKAEPISVAAEPKPGEETAETRNANAVASSASASRVNIIDVHFASERPALETASSNTQTSSEFSIASVAQPSTIAQLATLDDAASVSVQGVVTAMPGTFGNQVFFVDDDTGGIEIYKHDGLFPELALGDIVAVSGTLTTSYGHRRIKVAQTELLERLGGGDALEPMERTLDDLEDTLVGRLVRVRGNVSERSGSMATISDGSSRVAVKIFDATEITPASLAVGAPVEITGILSRYNETLRLLPRNTADVSIEEMQPATAVLETAEGTGKQEQQQSRSHTALILSIGALGFVGAMAAKHYYPRLKSSFYETRRNLRVAAQEAN